MDARNLETSGTPSTSIQWTEWLSLMGYAGMVAVTVSCLLGAAVVLLGS